VSSDKIQNLEKIFDQLVLVVDPHSPRAGTEETPLRAAKAWCDWTTSGYDKDPASVLKVFEDGGENYDEMVFQGMIPFFSTCEHHLLSFFGYASIAYIPQGRVVGLSKLARLVEIFSRRLQIQERLVGEIADAMMNELQPLGVGVCMQARHLCMESRGIQKIGTFTVTTALRGEFKTCPEVKAEFNSLVQTAMSGVVKL
jgi:GTP cyclohydrolase I